MPPPQPPLRTDFDELAAFGVLLRTLRCMLLPYSASPQPPQGRIWMSSPLSASVHPRCHAALGFSQALRIRLAMSPMYWSRYLQLSSCIGELFLSPGYKQRIHYQAVWANFFQLLACFGAQGTSFRFQSKLLRCGAHVESFQVLRYGHVSVPFASTCDNRKEFRVHF